MNPTIPTSTGRSAKASTLKARATCCNLRAHGLPTNARSESKPWHFTTVTVFLLPYALRVLLQLKWSWFLAPSVDNIATGKRKPYTPRSI